MDEISSKLSKIISKTEQIFYIGFDPFSPIIVQKLSAIKSNKDKQNLLQEIVDDDAFTKLDLGLSDGGKTVWHPLHKGKGENPSWVNTRNMARDINKAGGDVCFLPEYNDKTSADAIVKFERKLVLADFKYSTTTKISTLKKDLQDGFEQAGTIVLKLTNANKTVLEETVEEMKRKGYQLGNIKLINKHGRIKDIPIERIESGKYKKDLKGFL